MCPQYNKYTNNIKQMSFRRYNHKIYTVRSIKIAIRNPNEK